MTTKNHGTFLRADTDNHPPGVVSDYIDTTDQGGDPSAPGAGHTAIYSKTGGLYIENHAGTVTGPFIASALSNPMTTTGDIIYSSDNSGTPARRAIGGSNTVLHGGTTPTYGSVVETDFSFLDVTTANASTSKHGLLLKLNGSNATFLNGTGAWSTPAGSGSLEVKELDGSPDVTGVTIIQVSNGTLTNNGGGNVTITTGGGGGGGAAPPTIIAFNSDNGNTQNPGFTITAPANGHSVILGWNGVSRGVTSISSTNTTWTKMQSYTSGGPSHYEVWVGLVAGGTGGTAVTINTGSSNFYSVAACEVADTLTPTAGSSTAAALAQNGMATGPTGVTSGHFMAILLGADNTTNAFPSVGNVPSMFVPYVNTGRGTNLGVAYAPSSGAIQATFPAGISSGIAMSSAGGAVIVEIT